MNELTVSKLARQADVNVQTIRYYERQGLIPRPPRTPSGYRAFPPESAARVRFIRRAQEIGFSLADAKELLALREHSGTACSKVFERATQKLAEISDKIRALNRIERELSRLTKACSGREQPHSCPVLDALERNGKHDKAENKRSRRKAIG